MPGVLKNGLDWLSRPQAQRSQDLFLVAGRGDRRDAGRLWHRAGGKTRCSACCAALGCDGLFARG